MEHPSLNVLELKELTIEEIQSKISELVKRLTSANRAGQANLAYQVQMVLECYERAQSEKLTEMFELSGQVQGKIDIS